MKGQPHSIIAGVTFELAQNESRAIIGQSGSGKNTLLNIIGLLDFVDAGNMCLWGARLRKPGVMNWQHFEK